MDTGTRIGNYEIVGLLGQGAMGSVFKAKQLSMDRVVALKVLPAGLACDRRFVDRFLREAQSAAAINHQHLVNVIESGQQDGLYWFSMEYVPGATLGQCVEERGPLLEAEVIPLLRQIAEALQAAHDRGIVHRDIKPDNIMLDDRNEAKVADLGLAKPMAGKADVTLGGTAIGTPHYLSPEQARGLDTDGRSDIYSLGATAHFLVTGQTLFTGPSANAITVKHVTDEAPGARSINPTISAGLERVILRCLAKRPEQRYRDCRALIADLDLVQEGGVPSTASLPIQPRGTGHPTHGHRRTDQRLKRRKHRSRKPPALLWVAGVAVGLLVTVVAVAGRPGAADPAPAIGADSETGSGTTATAPATDPVAGRTRQAVDQDGERSGRRQQAGELLDQARRLLGDSPPDLAGARRAAERARLLAAGGSAEAQARALIDLIAEEERRQQLLIWRPLADRAEAQLEAGDYDGALAVIAELPTGSRHAIDTEVAGLCHRIGQAGDRAIIDLIGQARKAIEAGDPAGARQALAAIDAVPYAAGIQASTADRDHLQRRIRAYELAAVNRFRKQGAEELERFCQQLGDHKPNAAAATLASIAADTTADGAEQAVADLRALLVAWRAREQVLCERLADLVGEPVGVRVGDDTKNYTLTAVSEHCIVVDIVIDSQHQETTLPLARLDQSTRDRLLGGWRGADGLGAVLRCLDAFARGTDEQLDRHLDQAPDHLVVDHLRDRLEARRRRLAESAARQAWEDLRLERIATATSGQSEDLQAGLADFRTTHGDTVFFAGVADDWRRARAAVGRRLQAFALAEGLLGHWRFEEAGPLALDAGGRDLHLTVADHGKDDEDRPDDTAGLHGRGHPASHEARWEDRPTTRAVDGAVAISLSVWLRPHRVKKRAAIVRLDGSPDPLTLHWDREDDRTTLIITLTRSASDSEPVSLQTPFKPRPDQWHHLVVVFDGRAQPDPLLRLHIDGGLAVEGPAGSEHLQGPGTLVLGSRQLDAVLDECRCYARALAPDEVVALYQLDAPPQPEAGALVADEAPAP